MLNNVSNFSNAYLKNTLQESIIKGYEVDYVDYKNKYHRRSTQMADNPFIKDRIHDRITDKLSGNDSYIVYSNKRGSGGHILVFDNTTKKLYSIIQRDRYKTVKKEAIDPNVPAHYMFIYAQINPLEDKKNPEWTLFSLDEVDLNDLLISKQNHAKEESKKYLRNLKPESFVLIVYDLDRNTNTVASIEAFTPSSLYLTPLNEIENWLEHSPVFSFENLSIAGKEDTDNNEQLKGLDLKPGIKKQLEQKEELSVEKKQPEEDTEEMD